jgi:TP901 family phage tail tape measure protein
MASIQSVIEIVFSGVDEVSETAGTVIKGLEGLNNAASDLSEPFADLAKDLAYVQTAFVAFAGIIGTIAYNESVKFKFSLVDLDKALNDGEGNAADYTAAINDLALKYGENANTVIGATADFKQAGFTVSESLALVAKSFDLSIAGGVGFDQAVSIINKSLAGFEIANKDAIEVSKNFADVLNKTADESKSSFTELAQGFADLSPVAKLAGLSAADTAAILSKVIDVFGSGSEAANALGSAFVSLRKPTDDAAETMKKLGINFDAAGNPIGSIKEIISTLVPNFAKLSGSQQELAAATLFGKEQYDKMIPVLNNWNAAMDLSAKVAETAGGSVDKEVTKRLESAQQVIKSANEALRQLLTTLGNQYELNATGVIESLGNLSRALDKALQGPSLNPLFDLLRPQLKELENVFNNASVNLEDALKKVDFNPIVNALKNLLAAGKSAFEALFGPIDVSSVDGLAKAIQSVSDVIAGLANVTAGELSGLKPFLATVRELAIAFKDAGPETQGFIGNLLGLSVGFQQVTGVIDTALLGFLAFGSKLSVAAIAIKTELALIATTVAAGGAAVTAGVAGVVGVLAFELTRLTGSDKLLNDILVPDWLGGKGSTLGTALADLADSLGLLAPKIESAAPKLQQLPQYFDKQTDAAAETRKEINAYLDAQTEAAKVTSDTSKETDALTEAFRAQGYAYDALTGSVKKLADAKSGLDFYALSDKIKITDYVVDIGRASKAGEELVISYSNIDKGGTAIASGGLVKATGAFKSIDTSATEAAKKIDETTKKAQEYQLKLEEISSNERIKTIEAVIKLNVAQLETDMERVKAAFASIDNTVSSTGDLLGGLFGNLTDADFHARNIIENQIQLENKRRQDALDLQRKLAEAEIERINAQTAALDRGVSMIEIDGKGLQPQLEAFMFEILKQIRVKLTGSYSDFLLALAAPA